MNKKGFTYIITVSLLVAVLIGVFLTTQGNPFSEDQKSQEVRINLMNDFVKNLNQDMERSMFIAGYRSMISLEDEIARSGEFYNDTSQAFIEPFQQGTINGRSISVMSDSSINDYVNRVNEIGERLGLDVNVLVDNISLEQISPWDLRVEFFAVINITDTRDLAEWHYERMFVTEFPITNLRDPLYSIYTDNRLGNTVVRSNYTWDENDLSGFDNHFVQNRYVVNNDAPSFIDRFENRMEPSEFGIESLVDIRVISGQDVVVYPERSKIDWQYFNDLGERLRCDFEGVDAGYELVLPEGSLGRYNLSELNYSSLC